MYMCQATWANDLVGSHLAFKTINGKQYCECKVQGQMPLVKQAMTISAVICITCPAHLAWNSITE